MTCDEVCGCGVGRGRGLRVRWGAREGGGGSSGAWCRRCRQGRRVGPMVGGRSGGGGISGVGCGGGLPFRAVLCGCARSGAQRGGGALDRQWSRAGPPVGGRGGGVMCVGGVAWSGVGGALLPSRLLRGCGEEVEGELRPESLGKEVGALAVGYPRLGWPGCPGTRWVRNLGLCVRHRSS